MTGNGAIPGTCGALKAAPLPVMGADGLRPRRHDSRRWVTTKRDDPRLATARLALIRFDGLVDCVDHAA